MTESPSPAPPVARSVKAADVKDLAAMARRLEADGHAKLAADYAARGEQLRAHELHLVALSQSAGSNPGGTHAARGKRVADWLLAAGWTPPPTLLLVDERSTEEAPAK